MEESKMPKFLGFGNPLLDITIDGNQHLLDSYGLNADDQVLVTEKLSNIFDEVHLSYGEKLKFSPGGSTLNATRAVQWCLKESSSTSVIGCLGNDQFGDVLCRELHNAGVQTHFEVHPSAPTGTCLVICTGKNRSMVTRKGASALFTTDFLVQPSIQQVIQDVHYIYSSAFTLVGGAAGVEYLAKLSSECRDKVFALNLAARYVCKEYCQLVIALMPFVNVLFGNEEEAMELSKSCQMGMTSVQDIALSLSEQKLEGEHKLQRMVVITRGPQPAVLAYDGQVKEFPPLDTLPGPLVDTNGAGDGFVGGFLSSLMQNKDVGEAMENGHKTAATILTQRGFTLP